MQSHSKSNPSSMTFFYGKRDSSFVSKPPEVRPPSATIPASVFQKRHRNSEKRERHLVCDKHAPSADQFCSNCRRIVCGQCIAGGEHLKLCAAQRTPSKFSSAQVPIQVQVQIRAHALEFREKLVGAFEKATAELQLTEITTISHIEANFNDLIFEVERCKQSAVEAARNHFNSSHRRLETLKDETEKMLKKQTSLGNGHLDFVHLEANIKMAIGALNTFTGENRFGYEFDRKKVDQIRSFFRREARPPATPDEPNLLNMSIDNDEFLSIMGTSKANSVVFDQKSRESNILMDRPVKSNMRQTASSSKKRPEERMETSSLYLQKPDRNGSQFQSVYVAAVKARADRKVASNKENMVERKSIHVAGTETPKFIESRLENRLDKTKTSDFGPKPDTGRGIELSFTEKNGERTRRGSMQTFQIVEPAGMDAELNLSDQHMGAQDITEIIDAECRKAKPVILDISGNKIEDKGLRSLLKGLTKMGFETLICDRTGVSEVALDYFISFRKYNQRLQRVSLRGNGIREESASVVKKLKMLRDVGVEVQF